MAGSVSAQEAGALAVYLLLFPSDSPLRNGTHTRLRVEIEGGLTRALSDAKRPCSTCVRSHAHAVSHAPPNSGLPSEPVCTYDERERVRCCVFS